MQRTATAKIDGRRDCRAPMLLLLSSCILACGPAHAGEALVAVATNFSEVMDRLDADFEAAGEHELTVVTGSTGKLYAQIANGAPFDVFLAADQERPRLLVGEHRADPGSRFTYAIGRLALWSPDPARIGPDGAATLKKGDFRHLAIANADLAPYGVAARETLRSLGIYEQLEGRLIVGENIGQTYAMVATGNAELGLVALSSILSPANEHPGSRWDVPAELYAPIRQDAVLLERGRENAAARAFLDWLHSDDAVAVIEQFGYSVE